MAPIGLGGTLVDFTATISCFSNKRLETFRKNTIGESVAASQIFSRVVVIHTNDTLVSEEVATWIRVVFENTDFGSL